MSYERLTEHQKLCGMDYIKLKDCDRYDCEYCISPCEDAKDRLAELEDKIENGTLVELERKIGDHVFFIDTFCLNMGVPSRAIKEGNIVKINAQIQDKNIKYSYVVESFDRIFKLNDTKSHYVCSMEKVFTAKAEAEEKLRELRGEK